MMGSLSSAMGLSVVGRWFARTHAYCEHDPDCCSCAMDALTRLEASGLTRAALPSQARYAARGIGERQVWAWYVNWSVGWTPKGIASRTDRVIRSGASNYMRMVPVTKASGAEICECKNGGTELCGSSNAWEVLRDFRQTGSIGHQGALCLECTIGLNRLHPGRRYENRCYRLERRARDLRL